MCFALGPAGTGKTYLAAAKAIESLSTGAVDRIILSRPALEAGEQIGFLPGDMKEKVAPYLRPIYDALEDMIPRSQLEKKIESGQIEIAPLAFMRGRTLNDAFVILDEAQNTTVTKMKMFLTRLGHHSKMVITGDLSQIDLRSNIPSGLEDAMRRLPGIKGISFVKFNDNTYHMANQVKFVNDTFFLPINSFIYFCNQLNLQFISTDLEKNKAFISNSFNIRDFSIKEKDNNYVLSIFSEIDFNNIPPILKLLNDNQLQISIPTGKINLSSSPINTLDNITVTQNLNETLFLFNSNNEILNYSYNIKQDRVEIIITQTIKPQYTQNASDWQINTIIIDPGHGGKDPGAVGYRNIKEKHIVLDKTDY